MNSIADPVVLEAFVKQGMAQGLNEEQIKEAAWLQGHNETLQDPDVARGFASVLANYHGPLTQAALARYMVPGVIAAASEARLRLGQDASACVFRKLAGFLDGRSPESYVNPSLLDVFNRLSLPQKALVSSLIGGGAGGAYRYFNPSNEDLRDNRGELARAARGAGSGAVAGMGALAGAELAQRLGPGIGISRGLSATGGAIAGGLAGKNMLS